MLRPRGRNDPTKPESGSCSSRALAEAGITAVSPALHRRLRTRRVGRPHDLCRRTRTSSVPAPLLAVDEPPFSDEELAEAERKRRGGKKRELEDGPEQRRLLADGGISAAFLSKLPALALDPSAELPQWKTRGARRLRCRSGKRPFGLSSRRISLRQGRWCDARGVGGVYRRGLPAPLAKRGKPHPRFDAWGGAWLKDEKDQQTERTTTGFKVTCAGSAMSSSATSRRSRRPDKPVEGGRGRSPAARRPAGRLGPPAEQRTARILPCGSDLAEPVWLPSRAG